ncbi:alcohol dehydrogenase [Xanthomonas oryzae pv. oryzicola]|nr:alcohol dehydrogenase [Xanthomonas oryzae pv. oryzicola]
MKACQLGNQTGLESLVAAEMPEPVAGPGQVIVAPRLVGLINRDLQILKGTYAGKLAETRVPVAEGVGLVTSVGAGVSTSRRATVSSAGTSPPGWTAGSAPRCSPTIWA